MSTLLGRLRYVGVAMAGALVAVVAANCGGGEHPRPEVESEARYGEAGVLAPGTDGSTDDDASTSPRDDGGEQSSTCVNTVQDSDESDVDCGGVSSCARCSLGKACTAATDCEAPATCTNNICSLCEDGKTNGSETDVDCGGTACGPCTVGKRCEAATDCTTGACDNDKACACPPGMIISSLAAGRAFCIDRTEVTKGQYDKFWKANVPISTQIDACKTTNTTFTPRKAWPPATSPSVITQTFSLPVHYVDWCDAYAYCAWAKKELCGKVGGGELPAADGSNADVAAWYAACSAQGAQLYPYGPAFNATKCNGPIDPTLLPVTSPVRWGDAQNDDEGIYTVGTSDANGNLTTIPDEYAQCQGGAVGLFQMSGNVAEWENSCSGDTCAVRGGSFLSGNDPAALSCEATRSIARVPAAADVETLRDIGFRCCSY